jgi:uncharacterized protein YciI
MIKNNTTQVPSKIRYVFFHRPDPGWQAGVDFREQLGVETHVAHYHQLYSAGKLAMGGLFPIPDSGGMMITTEDVNHDEIESFAASDPAVKSGLIIFEIRPWYVAMEHSP